MKQMNKNVPFNPYNVVWDRFDNNILEFIILDTSISGISAMMYYIKPTSDSSTKTNTLNLIECRNT